MCPHACNIYTSLYTNCFTDSNSSLVLLLTYSYSYYITLSLTLTNYSLTFTNRILPLRSIYILIRDGSSLPSFYTHTLSTSSGWEFQALGGPPDSSLYSFVQVAGRWQQQQHLISVRSETKGERDVRSRRCGSRIERS
jgi:hypothetical protein